MRLGVPGILGLPRSVPPPTNLKFISCLSDWPLLSPLAQDLGKNNKREIQAVKRSFAVNEERSR